MTVSSKRGEILVPRSVLCPSGLAQSRCSGSLFRGLGEGWEGGSSEYPGTSGSVVSVEGDFHYSSGLSMTASVSDTVIRKKKIQK